MKLSNSADFARIVSRIALNDYLSDPGMTPSFYDEVEFNALLLRVEFGIHADGRGKIAILGQETLDAFYARGNGVFIELLPELQLARVYQLIRSGRTRSSIDHDAADE